MKSMISIIIVLTSSTMTKLNRDDSNVEKFNGSVISVQYFYQLVDYTTDAVNLGINLSFGK